MSERLTDEAVDGLAGELRRAPMDGTPFAERQYRRLEEPARPAPAVSLTRQALQRWHGAPDVEAYEQLKALDERLTALRARLVELEEQRAGAVIAGDDLDALTAEISKARGEIEAGESAIPQLEALIPEQARAHYEAEQARIEEALADALEEIKAKAKKYEKAKAAEVQARKELTSARTTHRHLVGDRSDILEKLRALK